MLVFLAFLHHPLECGANMTDSRKAELRGILQDFEAFLVAARRQKYSPETPEAFLNAHPLARWDLLALFDEYLRAGVYPPERLERLAHHLMDTKLQFYYLWEVDTGLYNLLVHGRGYDMEAPRANPHVFLTRLSLDQSLILKSRVLWERIMNLLFYLETGEELENKVSGKKSKRKAFFDTMLKNVRWRFLEPYRSLLDQYDAAFRTPEAHKGSVLRASLMGNASVDANQLLDLLNAAANALWDNMIAIIGGGRAAYFTERHLDGNGRVDPKYWT